MLQAEMLPPCELYARREVAIEYTLDTKETCSRRLLPALVNLTPQN
jgi:hypothetical protein